MQTQGLPTMDLGLEGLPEAQQKELTQKIEEMQVKDRCAAVHEALFYELLIMVANLLSTSAARRFLSLLNAFALVLGADMC